MASITRSKSGSGISAGQVNVRRMSRKETTQSNKGVESDHS